MILNLTSPPDLIQRNKCCRGANRQERNRKAVQAECQTDHDLSGQLVARGDRQARGQNQCIQTKVFL